jgi:hypothetical protein
MSCHSLAVSSIASGCYDNQYGKKIDPTVVLRVELTAVLYVLRI